MDPAAPLQTFRLEPGVALTHARPWQASVVTLASPALEVMTDLTLVKAATIHRTTPLHQAEQTMIFQGVRMLFVVSDMPAIEGLITSTDLHGDRQLRVVHERKLHYNELTVADVMTEFASLDAIAYEQLSHATVANLVATLKRYGRNHLLVVQAPDADSPRRVRGVISRAQIERQLGAPIDITPIANSFSEIERALH